MEQFYLLSKATLAVKSEISQLEVIGHYHDGVTVAVPKVLEKETIEAFNRQTLEHGQKLNLKYNQTMEVKTVFRAATGP